MKYPVFFGGCLTQIKLKEVLGMAKYRITLSRVELRLILKHHLPEVKITDELLDHLILYVESVIKGDVK